MEACSVDMGKLSLVITLTNHIRYCSYDILCYVEVVLLLQIVAQAPHEWSGA